MKDEDEPEVTANSSDGMRLQERMSLWEKNENLDGVSPAAQFERFGDEETEDKTASDSRLFAYREFIPRTEAYGWLLTRLLREYRLAPTEPETIRVIRGAVLSSLQSDYRISRKKSSQSFTVIFELIGTCLNSSTSKGTQTDRNKYSKASLP